MLTFQANPCNQKMRKTCKSLKEAKEFLLDKFFILFYNKVEFITNGFGDKSFKTITKTEWLPIDNDRQL
jgi:hypothetical protein